jgi:hypothetical protein
MSKSKKILMKDINLDYLINIGNKIIPVSDNFNMERLENVLPSLIKLNNIIGMDSAKLTISKIIVLYTSNLCDKNNDMMHTMIQGGSGTGKTMLARIIGEIYWKLGILDNVIDQHNVVTDKVENNDNGICRQLRKKHKVNHDNDDGNDSYDYGDGFMVKDDESESYHESESDNSILSTDSIVNTKTYKFIEASRTDCIDRYQGGTALKTANLIKSALGGVLFIDEAYSLGNAGNEDSYNKECIDTLTSLMEKYKGKVIIILGGYKNSMEDALLKYNEGLSRRITFTITVDSYTPLQLGQILNHMINNISIDEPWTTNVPPTFLTSFFTKNIVSFPHFGGDVETLVFHIKLNHSLRLLHAPLVEKKRINKEDIFNAYQDYMLNRVT